jgi:hypothetical protein
MLVLRGFITITMSLFALYKIFINDKITILSRYVHFWFWLILLFIYTGSYFFWAYVKMFSDNNIEFKNLISMLIMQSVVNIIGYMGFTLVFFFYPKMFTER